MSPLLLLVIEMLSVAKNMAIKFMILVAFVIFTALATLKKDMAKGTSVDVVMIKNKIAVKRYKSWVISFVADSL